MSRNVGLTPLFSDERPDVGFRQGVVLSWDETTGSNQVDVGGTLLTNLPALNIGDLVILQEGDIVGLLRFQNTYFILGRIILPTGPDLNRATVALDGATGFQTNFTVPPAFAVRASGVITVPPWADEAIVMATTTASVKNTSAQLDFGECETEIEGIGGGGMLSTFEAGEYGVLVSACQVLLNSPGPTITVQSMLKTNSGAAATWAADPVNLCVVTSIAMFRRVN